MRGFCTYEAHCVACHGAAAVAREQWVNGLEPDPPYLLDATSHWKPRELFWIVKNGIKMTGMPSWRESLTDRQIWDVVAWLEATRQLPPQTYVRWRAEGRCTSPIGLPSPALSPTPCP
jgi:mono/diheme cytochrome c family protein